MAVKALSTYRSKRDFQSSPEPKPVVKPASTGGPRSFCVQKHLASHLHYDFRLEHNGVLLSWAVPKGPSLNPADKRLAAHVEDHPVDYGDFEGVIPSGYGAGVVMLWDRGTWTPETPTADVDAALAKGEIKFSLDGVKLKGSWVLVRTRRPTKGPEQWLLIKHRDRWAGELDVVDDFPDSVKSFGGLPAILARDGIPKDWKAHPPVRGGETGKLLAEVMRAAAESTVAESKSSTVKRRGAAAPARKATAGVPKSALVFGARVPRLTNPDKILFPKTGFAKKDLVDYYQRIAPLILPHLRGRAATLKRYPDGVDGKFFFEKRCAAHRPDWVKTVTVARSDAAESIDYCEIADISTLAWAGNMAAIELHVPLAAAKFPDRPTAMVFDLDPGPPATTTDCCRVAVQLRELFEHLGLVTAIKTSGGKGLHLYVPLNTVSVTFDETKSFARAVAVALQKADPTRVTAEMTRSVRPGKVFIDWSQNDRNKTTASVFSVRARPTPTVSWPQLWTAVEADEIIQPTADGVQLDDPAIADFAKAMRARQKLPTVRSLGSG